MSKSDRIIIRFLFCLLVICIVAAPVAKHFADERRNAAIAALVIILLSSNIVDEDRDGLNSIVRELEGKSDTPEPPLPQKNKQ